MAVWNHQLYCIIVDAVLLARELALWFSHSPEMFYWKFFGDLLLAVSHLAVVWWWKCSCSFSFESPALLISPGLAQALKR